VGKSSVVARNPVPKRSSRGAFLDPGTALTGLQEIYLHPGQNHVSSGPVTLKMILGSCAGVFFFDPHLRIGGATHFMLPRHGAGQASPRYGDVAIAELLEKMSALGSSRKDVQAKVYGGASMLSALRGLSGDSIGQIGRRNVESALTILTEAAIAVVEKDVLGELGRKVSMVSHTGAITLEFVSNSDGD
jgi:chemotaxis protein CheD